MRERGPVLRSVGAALCLALVLLGGPAGCGTGTGAGKKAGIVVPDLFYLRPHGDRAGPTNKVPFHVQAEDATARSGFGAQDHRLTVDVTGSGRTVRLKISDIRKKNPRCAGSATRVVCRVGGTYDSWSDLDRVHPFAAPGAEPGDSATVRFRFTVRKGQTLTARTRVVVGEPVVKVRTTKVFEDVGPGSVLSTPVVVRNTGEVPVRGVGLELAVGAGMGFEDRYGNCRYPEPQKGSVAVCEFPGLRIPPGKAVVLHPDLALRIPTTRTDTSFRQEAWALDMGPAKYSVVPEGGDSGDGPRLTTRAAKESDLSGTFAGGPVGSDVQVDTYADFEVLGAEIRGERGSEHTVRLSVRNNGPAAPGTTRLLFTPPPGATVVEQPEEAIDEDVYEPSCDLAKGTYSCYVRSGLAPGETSTFDFTLRLGGPGEGEVRVTDAAGTDRRDPDPANDTAPVTVLP
ncbi:DUF11 domain-containing protein [Streptomyces aurantiacus]|uniref:DUF11 domain-containing protein n=1 Tax=Streptomyces aurantiacus TaxID=47760 RepID=A0A7G1P1P6_9ACTN|nr:DUF11 domain-containing protein [Streptomyces aurantiacus]BCL26985.1 hypothetical protein GCM10017557_18440 [Streptomyces aurantiacus]